MPIKFGDSSCKQWCSIIISYPHKTRKLFWTRRDCNIKILDQGNELLKIIVFSKYCSNFFTFYFKLNASDDRGIGVVREQILGFASTRTIFKLVIFHATLYFGIVLVALSWQIFFGMKYLGSCQNGIPMKDFWQTNIVVCIGVSTPLKWFMVHFSLTY